ncbi:MAG TPA: helix-turn-helix domain-containing protein [Solirubrobacterales bacterium]|nr:helix-turn-helix domain-containing protein [Solirubrobacterales bacterium]
MTNLNRSDDHNLLVALRHPVRRKLLRRMIGEDAISPRELATDLDIPLSNVAYHMRVLADNGAVTLVKTRPVRGSMQHFYRAAIEAVWAQQVLGLSEDDDSGTGESPGRPET